MPQPPDDPELVLFQVGMMVLSIVACMNLISMRRNGPLLPYEPRRPVPWGPIGCLLAMLMLFFVGISAFDGDGDTVGKTATEVGSSPKLLSPWSLVGGMLVQMLIVLAFLLVVAVFSNANARDLGIGANNRQRLRDVLVGAAACLAILAPVHIVQLVMMNLLFPDQMESGHPIIKRMLAAPDAAMLFWGGVATVVVAPICEEITFRLLFQGWLERWEDERLGWRTPAIESAQSDDEMRVVSDDLPQSERLSLEVAPTARAAAPSTPESSPPYLGILRLPYGWFPIIVSAAVFGLVHYGYGPEPVPIFVLGLALGYVYQRTHRLLPSIVIHALFNLFTMIILWRMVYHHG